MPGTVAAAAGYPVTSSRNGFSLPGRARILFKKPMGLGVWVKEIAAAGGGRGGGRPNMAQAGMPDAAALEKALQAADDIIAAQSAG